jgi:hypothetical protein
MLLLLQCGLSKIELFVADYAIKLIVIKKSLLHNDHKLGEMA